MALSKVYGVEIKGLESIVPSNVEDNLELPFLSQNERESLVQHTGIRHRRILKKEIEIKKLYQKGISNLLSKLNWEMDSIDILICVTQTTKISIPSVSCQLHGDLKMSNDTLCYDINSGCSGFVYGMHTISTLLLSVDNPNARAILCCGDISSQLIEPNDTSAKPIFSDAISVIAIEKSAANSNVTGYYNLQTDGSGQNAIYTENNDLNNQYMKLNGIDIFNYSIKLVPNNISNLLKYANQTIDYPDLFVFHQANKLINDSIAKRLQLNFKKVPSSLYEFGNTASASIPLTIGINWSKETSNSGWILISGFGVGFSVASALIKFNPIAYSFPTEINFEL
ncbi:MAG: 3-oxoacyl-[acyl-carrier-protein] synthase 3 [Bacteroidota bacterium]|jgi:3-oxoacyl-[acyl-carrier-protein] synthase-3